MLKEKIVFEILEYIKEPGSFIDRDNNKFPKQAAPSAVGSDVFYAWSYMVDEGFVKCVNDYHKFWGITDSGRRLLKVGSIKAYHKLIDDVFTAEHKANTSQIWGVKWQTLLACASVLIALFCAVVSYNTFIKGLDDKDQILQLERTIEQLQQKVDSIQPKSLSPVIEVDHHSPGEKDSGSITKPFLNKKKPLTQDTSTSL